VNSRRFINAGNAVAWLVTAAVATAIGLAGNRLGGRLPGSEPLTVEDVVDAVGALALGGLGVVLVRRRRADGLGRVLVALAALAGAVWLTGGIADLLAMGGSPSTTARVLNLLCVALFVPLFVTMVLGPLLLFPTGTLPSSRWRWLGWLAVTATLVSMLSILVKPGPIDDEVSAWGDNPLGIRSLAGAIDVIAVGALIGLLVLALGGAAAVISRLVRYRGARRRQVVWFLAGALPMLVGLFTDPGASVVAQTVSAVVIFGGLIGSMTWALLGGPAQALQLEHPPTVPAPASN
jgi:hypothetical protein